MIFALGAAFIITALGLWPLREYLLRKTILDHPNQRSSHTVPTPRGAGIVVLVVIASSWVVLQVSAEIGGIRPELIVLVLMALLIGVISWIDDLKGVPFVFRLLTHVAAVGLSLQAMPDGSLLFQGLLPPALDWILTLLLWVWFINLYNFMDGIDGITAIETITICLGVVGVGIVVPQVAYLSPYAVTVLGAIIGFLIWNWFPARIFLGDVGSASIGFLVGWLLLSLAAAGLWSVALILPAYYLVDATITLFLRMARGEKIWLAHRSHFYQLAVQSGVGHARVSLCVGIAGLIQACCAVASVAGYLIEGLFVSLLTVLGLIVYFTSRPTRTD